MLTWLGAGSQSYADSINEKVVSFLKSKVGMRVGGGECAHAASEALRVAGAAFTPPDLPPDAPEAGDYVWGTLVKVVSSMDDQLTDSEPANKVLPGDVLQYHGSRLVSVIRKGDETITRTSLADHHTSMAARMDDQGRFPVEVFEQNAPAADDEDKRTVQLNSIDLTTLRAGWVRIYRPKPRTDKPGRYLISVVNNTDKDQAATVRFEGSTAFTLSLTAANTATSYTLPAMTTTATTRKFTMALDTGASVTVYNAAGYEIYTNPKGEKAIRKLGD